MSNGTQYFVSPMQPGVRPMDPPDYDGITFVYVFTSVLDPFVQPPANGQVTLVVANAQGFVPGMTIVIEGGGYYEVVSTDALNRIVVQNFGTSYNQPPGTGIMPGKITTTSLPGPPGGTGPVGPQGPIGLQGPIGNTGPQGPIGNTGPTGSQGPIGNTGATGSTGPQGAQGPQGATGAQGPPGAAGTTVATTTAANYNQPAVGANVPVTVTSAAGISLGLILYIQGAGYYSTQSVAGNVVTLQNLGYTGNAAPGTVINSGANVGATGPQGPVGPQGPTGSQGAQGAAGATGSQGPQGATGPAGPTMISANANNKATLGSDSLTLVQGTAAGVAATTHAQTVSGDDPQLTNARTPIAHQTSHVTGTDQIPNASSSTRGLLAQLSGNTTDYVGGDNACHALASVFPTGMIADFAGSAAPSGWLICDGSAQSRTTYAALFAVVGTTYGTGDGSTTFNLPDLRGRVAIGVGMGSGLTNRVLGATGGEETHQLTIAELASHSHTVNETAHAHTLQTPLQFMGSGGVANMTAGTAWGAVNINTQTATTGITNQNTGSGTAHNNIPPFVVTNKIIKT